MENSGSIEMIFDDSDQPDQAEILSLIANFQTPCASIEPSNSSSKTLKVSPCVGSSRPVPENTPSRRKRYQYDREELDLLKTVWNSGCHFPSSFIYECLANKFGVHPRKIQIWFQNKRAQKKKEIKDSRKPLKSDFGSATNDLENGSGIDAIISSALLDSVCEQQKDWNCNMVDINPEHLNYHPTQMGPIDEGEEMSGFFDIDEFLQSDFLSSIGNGLPSQNLSSSNGDLKHVPLDSCHTDIVNNNAMMSIQQFNKILELDEMLGCSELNDGNSFFLDGSSTGSCNNITSIHSGEMVEIKNRFPPSFPLKCLNDTLKYSTMPLAQSYDLLPFDDFVTNDIFPKPKRSITTDESDTFISSKKLK